MAFDLISIGDARIDNFLEIEDAKIQKINEVPELLLRWGDKIPVTSLHTMPAGNNNNNAVGVARLKMKVALYTNVGKDSDGSRIIDHLKTEGVATKYVTVHEGKVTENSFVLNHQGERTILVYHEMWDFKLPDLDTSRWLYFSSVSPSFVRSGLIGQIENYLERSRAKLIYNPGTHQLKHGVKKYPRLLTMIKLLIVNKEEAKIVLSHNITSNIPIKRLLKDLADLGPELVVITDGGKGSFGFDGEKYYSLGVFPAKLVEMTGAGDAYATGTLAGLFHGKDLAEAMRWGAANAASVVEEIGPQAGLLTYNKMMDRLKESSKIVVKEI